MIIRQLIIYLISLCLITQALSSDKEEIDSLHRHVQELLPDGVNEALLLSQQAEQIAHESGLTYEEANSLFIQAYIYRQNNELGKSFVINLRALELLRPLQDETSQLTYVKILLNTGEILKQHYSYADAVKYYDEAIEIAHAYHFNDRLTRLYYSKAMSLRHNGDYDYALQELNKALSYALTYEDEYLYVLSLNQRGLIEKDMGLYGQARDTYQVIVDYEFEKLEKAKYIGQAWHNIGKTFKLEGDYLQAIGAYKRAEQYHTVKQDKAGEFATWLELSENYFLNKDDSVALSYGYKALTLYEDISLLPDHYRVFDVLSKISYSMEDYDASHAFSQQYMAVNKRFLEAQEEILRVKDQYKMEVLTAGFFVELNASRRESEFEWYLMLLGLIAVTIIIFGRSRFLLKKRSIQKCLSEIERQSDL